MPPYTKSTDCACEVQILFKTKINFDDMEFKLYPKLDLFWFYTIINNKYDTLLRRH